MRRTCAASCLPPASLDSDLDRNCEDALVHQELRAQSPGAQAGPKTIHARSSEPSAAPSMSLSFSHPQHPRTPRALPIRARRRLPCTLLMQQQSRPRTLLRKLDFFLRVYYKSPPNCTYIAGVNLNPRYVNGAQRNNPQSTCERVNSVSSDSGRTYRQKVNYESQRACVSDDDEWVCMRYARSN